MILMIMMILIMTQYQVTKNQKNNQKQHQLMKHRKRRRVQKLNQVGFLKDFFLISYGGRSLNWRIDWKFLVKPMLKMLIT